MFMARTVEALGEGGQRLTERESGWNCGTVRKGRQESSTGLLCGWLQVAWAQAQRKALSNLLGDITSIVDGQSQADPQFRTTRLYTRLTATEVRRQLIAKFGYTDEELPTARPLGPSSISSGTIRKRWPRVNSKKTPRDRCHLCPGEAAHEEADADEQVLGFRWMPRPSSGRPLRPRGKSRVQTKAADHDFEPRATVTPVGIFLPSSDELFLYGVTSKVTSDCLVDRLVDWWRASKSAFPHHDPAHQFGQWPGEPQPADPVHASPGGVCPAISPHHTPCVLSAVSQ